MAKLTATTIRALKTPGKYGDGDGLWLVVTTADRRSWFLRYGQRGRAREMSLGSAAHVTLAEARERAQAARRLLAQGIDPIDHRRAESRADGADGPPTPSFTEAAEAYIVAHEAGWRSPIHRKQWRSTLATYAAPVMGARPVRDVTTDHVLAVLQPIWTTKPETASRLRGRIEMILSYATARGWRDGPNPAVWRGHLQLMLPAPGKVRPVEHHAALDWREAPAFMAELRSRVKLRGARTRFSDPNRHPLGRGAWRTLGGDRRRYRYLDYPGPAYERRPGASLPLSAPARAILDEMAKLKDGSGLVFLGMKRGVVVSDMTLTAVLRRMGRGDLTAHGFRSSFRDWAAETTAYPNHVVEGALAHTIGDKVERAYRRGDLFEKRTALMADWAAYLARPAADVLRFGRDLLRAASATVYNEARTVASVPAAVTAAGGELSET